VFDFPSVVATICVIVGVGVSPSTAQSQSQSDAENAVQDFTDQMMGEYERQAHQEIDASCADKWPQDYEMQNFCYQSNVKARNEAQAYDLTTGPPELTMIWAQCSMKWSDSKDRVNWEMMNFCMEKQTQALREIQKRRR
jgi:hypothetical protein